MQFRKGWLFYRSLLLPVIAESIWSTMALDKSRMTVSRLIVSFLTGCARRYVAVRLSNVLLMAV